MVGTLQGKEDARYVISGLIVKEHVSKMEYRQQKDLWGGIVDAVEAEYVKNPERQNTSQEPGRCRAYQSKQVLATKQKKNQV